MRRLLVLPGLLLAAAASHAQDYDEAMRLYKEWIRRPAFSKRQLARERLADTEDTRAMHILMATYAKPEAPKEQVRTLVVNLVAEVFGEAEQQAQFAPWREKHDRREDAWLWYQTLRASYERDAGAAAEAVARSGGEPFLRAAALEALRMWRHPALPALVVELAPKLPTDPMDRAVLLESLTAALCAVDRKPGDAAMQEPMEALFLAMEHASTPERTRMVMARHFVQCFKVKFPWLEAGKWREELEFAQRGGKVVVDERYGRRPTFAGIEATGDRVCYVIDLSDSMLEPLEQGEIEKLPKGPVSGSAQARQREKEAKSAAWRKAFEQVKWSDVKNRFDAARELLKTSLLLLEEDQYYAVIAFGDEAKPLRSTRGLTKATAGNVRKTISELDSIRPGPKRDDRPHGVLMGKTNLHGGLLLAFRMAGRGDVGEGEYVDLKTFKDGCDTVFVLSDGDPTWDNWPATDRKDLEDQAGDPETGARHADSDTLNFPGPFERGYHLVSDLRRLNLFRKAEIHAVGMGEANMDLLERIARAGNGQSISLRRQ